MPAVDRDQYPYQYTGPDWGLKHDTPCKVLGDRSGGRWIETPDGNRWVVDREHVEQEPMSFTQGEAGD